MFVFQECCRTQNYFDNMIFVFLKLLSITDPAFSPENDIFVSIVTKSKIHFYFTQNMSKNITNTNSILSKNFENF